MDDLFLSDLINNLRFHMAWVAICDSYLREQPKSDIVVFLQGLRTAAQSAIEILSHELRQHGISPTRLGSHENLLTDGLNRKTPHKRMQFIQIGLARSLAWYEERLANPDPEIAAFWQELYDLQATQAAAATALLQKIESPQKTG